MAVSLPLWVSAFFESGGFFAAETGSFFLKVFLCGMVVVWRKKRSYGQGRDEKHLG